LKSYRILPKIELNTALKSKSSKASTPLNEKYRVLAIYQVMSIRSLDAFLMQFSMVSTLTYCQTWYILDSLTASTTMTLAVLTLQ